MRQIGLARLLMLFAMQCAGCSCPPKAALVFGPLPGEQIEATLQAHSLRPKENFKITLLDEAEGSSYHLVQVRDKERLHRHNTHYGKVLLWRGHGTLLLDGKSVALKKGDLIVIPQRAPHAYTNEADQPTVAVVQFTPEFDGKDTEYLE